MTKRKSSASDENALSTPLTKQVAKALTVSELISLGESAGRTMESDAVRVTIDLLMEELYAQIATSHPKESQARESAYLQLHALVKVMTKMRELHEVSKMKIEEIQSQPQREQAEYYDQQGFG